ncbi:VCBS repeat-containing protein [Sorangium sp. So ce1036]|uniref:FG-GAP repeat domain-containing protein n=1 Tax=Sorangium sp. So ce1036 TaxID=3133328 RepID=UPI003EFCBA72
MLDVNADGLGDVFWRDPERGLAATWLMEGNRLLAPGPTIPCPLGGGWAATTADFDGDGLADVLWNHVEQGLVAVELVEGVQPLALGPVIPGPGGGGWHTIPSDFNGDNMADVLWGHAGQGAMAIWLMEGTRLLAPGPVIPGPPGDGWDVVSAGELNVDGLADMVWAHAESAQMAIWLMEGTRLLAPGPEIPGPLGDGWVFTWTDDFDADGIEDVLWNHPEQNLMAVWLMEGTRVRVPGPEIPGPPGDGWRARTAGDVNGDDMADVVWQRGDTMTVWLMEGTRVLAPGPLIPGPYGG